MRSCWPWVAILLAFCVAVLEARHAGTSKKVEGGTSKKHPTRGVTKHLDSKLKALHKSKKKAKSLAPKLNDKPMIGILTQKISDRGLLDQRPELFNQSYIAASYVKWLQSGGARAVAIHPEMSDKTIDYLMGSISGMFFPGGGKDIDKLYSGYGVVGRKLYSMAVDMNDRGIHFPIGGTCLGIQALAVFEEGDAEMVGDSNSYNYTTSMKLMPSPFWDDIGEPLRVAVENTNITSHFHNYGILPSVMKKSPLKKDFRALGVSKDRNGKEFVGIMQGKNYPFYGIQFHPEKPMFEWADTLNIPHESNAIRFGSYLAVKFVDEARKNWQNRFPSYRAESKASVNGDRVLDISQFSTNSVHTPLQQIYVYDVLKLPFDLPSKKEMDEIEKKKEEEEDEEDDN